MSGGKLHRVKEFVSRHAPFIPPGLRSGKDYRRWSRFLSRSQWWSEEEIRAYQDRTLRGLLELAYGRIPYFRALFRRMGMVPSDIDGAGRISLLPEVNKDLIKANLAGMVVEGFAASRLQYVTTGGSTGIPMGFYWEKGRTDAIETAFLWRAWKSAGCRPGMRWAIVRGAVIGTAGATRQAEWWAYDRSRNSLSLSSYLLSEANADKYLEKLEEFRPEVLQGYPSSLSFLARCLAAKNRELDGIRVILTSSETLFPDQRSLIERTFHAGIVDHYGNTERTVLTMQCEQHRGHHVIPEYGITELVDFRGDPVVRNGETGRIVSTGFINRAMPLIRYDTGDRAVLSTESCPCGRKHRIFTSIEGRTQEIIVTSDRRLISMTAINMHGDVFDRVSQIQFHQKKEGEIDLRIVKSRGYSDTDTRRIMDSIGAKIGGGMEIRVSFVDSIEKTERGKHRWLVQELNVQEILSRGETE